MLNMNIGEYAMNVNTKDLPTGIYYVILSSKNKKLKKKLNVRH